MMCLNPLLDLNPEICSANLINAIKQEPQKMQEVMTDRPKDFGIIGQFDGACQKGKISCAYVVYDGNMSKLHSHSYRGNETTSNQAEY